MTIDPIAESAIEHHRSGRFREAVALYEQSLAVDPHRAFLHINLGAAYQSLGRLDEAIVSYRRALAISPDDADAWNNLGITLESLGRLDEALDAFRQAIAHRPEFPLPYNNLGQALSARREFAAAIPVLQKALELDPHFPQAWYNLGNALQATGDFAEAVAAYRRAIERRPDFFEARQNLGNALQGLGDFAGAETAYRQALKLRPDSIDARINLGAVLRTIGKVDESIAILRETLGLQSDSPIAWCNLGNALKDTGDLSGAIDCYRRAVELQPDDHISHSNLVFSLHYHPDYDAAAILREAVRWNARHAQPLAREIETGDPSPATDRRLRVGYLGADFRDHCQSLFTIPLLSHHDRGQFEIFCYAGVPRGDALTDRLRNSVDVWRNIHGSTDRQAADLIRNDRLDLLVDLTMHMSNGRPLVLARKPAPIQVAWLAYPGTTGLSTMDYRLTDPYLDPPGESDWHYSERSVRLPETFWCYDPLANEPAPNSLPAAENGGITFGCLNNFCKLTPATIGLWSQVLARVPESRLLLLAPAGAHRQRILDEFHRHNAQARVEFVPYQPREQYLRLYHQIDLCLDTFPYNGHTTSLDAFWMGVPVVTRIGTTVVGRAGFSQLCNLGLRELAADSDERFIEIASDLARDHKRLAELRSSLRERMQRSPLMDAPRFARNVEAAYREMIEALRRRF